MNNSENQTSFAFCKYWHPDTEVEKTAKIMVVIVVGGFALLGNVLIILLAAKYTVRKNINYMIINMALSDILVVLLFSSVLIHYNVSGGMFKHIQEKLSADILCKMRYFWEHTAKLVTLVNLLIISVERFRATRSTVHRAQPHSRKTRTIMVLGSWLLPMSLTAYNLYSLTSFYSKYSQSYWCIHLSFRSFLIWCTVFLAFAFISLMIIVILGTLTLRSLSRSNAMLANLSNIQRQRRAKQMSNAVRMVLCSLLLYTCCYLPVFSMDLYWTVIYNKWQKGIKIQIPCIDWNALFFMEDLLLLVNSFLSPCIYIIFFKDFREAAKSLLLARQTLVHNFTAETMEIHTVNITRTSTQPLPLRHKFVGLRVNKVAAIDEPKPTELCGMSSCA